MLFFVEKKLRFYRRKWTTPHEIATRVSLGPPDAVVDTIDVAAARADGVGGWRPATGRAPGRRAGAGARGPGRRDTVQHL